MPAQFEPASRRLQVVATAHSSCDRTTRRLVTPFTNSKRRSSPDGGEVTLMNAGQTTRRSRARPRPSSVSSRGQRGSHRVRGRRSVVLELRLCLSARRGTPERRRVGADERVNDLRQSTQVKMEQAADSVMVVKPISLGRKWTGTRRAFKWLDAGNQAPSAALVAPDDRSRGTQPTVVQQDTVDGSRGFRIRQDLRIERQDAGALAGGGLR